MKRLSSRPAAAVTLVCVALCVPGWLLGSDRPAAAPGNNPFANWYGRAGGPVGADAIDAVSKGASPAPASAQVQWAGRAGSRGGTDAVEALSHITVAPEALPPKAFDGWYGRAGGPLGLPSAAADHASPTAEAEKRDYVWEVFGPSVRSVATGDCVRVGMWVPEASDRPCETQPQMAKQPPSVTADAKSAQTQTPPEPRERAASDAPVARTLPPPPEVTSAPSPAPPAQAVAPEPSPPDTMPAPSPPAANGPEPEAPLHITLDAETHFNFNKFQLKPAGQAKVDQLLAELAQRHYDAIVVTGHTDRIGTKAYNETLSERRALSVKRYLTKKGVDGKKIRARGVGATEPVTSPDACEGLGRPKMIQCLAPDRRVELVVVGAHAQ
jgi:OmpA-OmpF porin, OOP family